MKTKINSTLIKKLTPAATDYEVHDIDLRGFAIRVYPSGVMRYFCQYGRGKKITIGSVGVMTPAQAREKAVEILNNVHNGIEPQGKKRLISLKNCKNLSKMNINRGYCLTIKEE